jgi:glutamyl-tRNA(Gln) amidotransferase subunit E
MKSDEFPGSFERRLRPSQSELGHIDPAAVFEFNKAKGNLYLWSPESSCLVEADDEPPHSLNEQALETTVLLSVMLNSHVVDEVHVMRKIVIDGSTTSGFQRTAVVALGGLLKFGDESVRVQALTLEEDAARIVGEDDRSRHFALDRLGVPLVEIALDPVVGEPERVEKVALQLGRTLRSTGRVARGIGTIRQDLNISLMGGEVIEVKGVQKLNLLSKVIKYEATRQMGLIKIAEEMKKRGVSRPHCRIQEITVSPQTTSPVLQRVLQAKGKIYSVVVRGMAGLIGYEPFPGIRLGKELAEIARANSLGGIIHSDEFRKQKIEAAEESELRAAAGANEDDALIVVAGDSGRVENVSNLIVRRLEVASLGVPNETRSATDEGETRYMRPRPGAARLYPETDIPEIIITEERIRELIKLVPEPWEAKVRTYTEKHNLSKELALQLYDSNSASLFEELADELELEPSVIATVLTELPVRLSREGVDESKIAPATLADLIRRIDRGIVAKEAAVDILRLIGKGEADDVEEATTKLGLGVVDKVELVAIIDEVIARNASVIVEKGERSFSPLMGEVMKALRGRVDGALLSELLRKRLAEKNQTKKA